MKKTPMALAIASVLAAAATGAAAQTYGQAYQTYQQQYSTYQAQQVAYNAARAKYEADRAAYDARYGYGAYERAYGPFRYTAPSTYGYGYGTSYPYGSTYPTTSYPYGSTYPSTSYPYGSTYPSTSYPNTYGYGYGTPYGTTPYGYGSSNPYNAGAYGVNSAYGNPCVNASAGSNVNLSILSALAQAALGGRSLSTNNIISQAVLGSAVSNSLGARTTSNVKCDSYGPYYTRSQTQAYREGYYDQYGRWITTPTPPQYARCRLAPAPTTAYGSEYRLVRVCPDSSGRYRITA
jgi:hypothetical protein